MTGSRAPRGDMPVAGQPCPRIHWFDRALTAATAADIFKDDED